MRKDSIQSRKRKPKNKKTEEGADDKEKEKKAPGKSEGGDGRENENIMHDTETYIERIKVFFFVSVGGLSLKFESRCKTSVGRNFI